MIQALSTKYSKPIASTLALIIYTSMLLPLYSAARVSEMTAVNFIRANEYSTGNRSRRESPKRFYQPNKISSQVGRQIGLAGLAANKRLDSVSKVDIGGPSQPEMASFKSAGTNDMVNLFTGDFSYNIPLLDVGGYPVNIFYNGGIGMEQEASWVGLGWNINPGTITRNMRGVPDDFDGTEKLIQSQNMKKNITWGVNIGADLELVGIKDFKAFQGSVGASIGFSLNNYLGPSIETGIKGSTSFNVGAKGISEKGPVGVSAGIGANLNSRSGLTLTPNLSLSAKSQSESNTLSTGIGLSTSYNSRSGIRGLQLYEQLSMSYANVKDRKGTGDDNVVNRNSMGAALYSTSISFLKPSYLPSLRPTITNSSGAGRFQLGLAMFGIYGSAEVEGYGQVSEIEERDQTTTKPMIGYLHAEAGVENQNAIMDFTRFNDQEVTPNTTIISVPQYTYDVFSIQGEGTGGSIRAYRNDNGYVRDNFTSSKDKSWSAGVDIGIPGHVGANFNTVKTPSYIGEWGTGNKLRSVLGFTKANNDFENVYFRNPGENSVIRPGQYDQIGGTDLVRFKLGGTGLLPSIEPTLERINSTGNIIGEVTVQPKNLDNTRMKRTQVVSFLTAEEASHIGLDKEINVYESNSDNFLDDQHKMKLLSSGGDDIVDGKLMRYSEEPDAIRKKHHISQINVTESDGKRYVYGVPVYNTMQKDLTFTVANSCRDCDVVGVGATETLIQNEHMDNSVGGKDGYIQITETPAYAHSFLLSGLLSPDYVDVKGDGITEDDLGTAVKFNYTRTGLHKWRTPFDKTFSANSNPGTLSEEKDDKGIISFGERESWYLHSIESKTMVAFFTLADRDDGKGPNVETGSLDNSNNSVKQLLQIDLYNKADLKKNGISSSKPIKTVHFKYENFLCSGTPDNTVEEGKLTLTKIWFTYNGQARQKKTQYLFSYAKGEGDPTIEENPLHQQSASDRWGNYKPSSQNPDGIMNRDYPYATQNKENADQNANAWQLKKILLPSGGKLEVEYESDDYAFVQNKRAANMSAVIGLGSSSNAVPTNALYTLNSNGEAFQNNFIFIHVDQACANDAEVFDRYLKGLDQLLVKMNVMMPKEIGENITAYAKILHYGVYSGSDDPSAIWIEMATVIDKEHTYSPLTMTALEFLRERLPAQAFGGYDVSDGSTLDQLNGMFSGLTDGIASAFKDIPQYLMSQGKAQYLTASATFARVNNANGFKLGGGHRVKQIKLSDNWDRMTQQFGSYYGQEYDYTTTEVFRGEQRTISSGVASYEPSLGGEENPFQSIVQIENSVPLGPTSYGAIEMPVLDAFFPAPLVGYSKVTVTSIGKKQNPDPENKRTRSGVGRQVTEFYTAKDYPVFYDYTTLDPSTDMQEHENPTLTFFYKHAFDSRAMSQGFLIAVNDMHGKMKSQASYAENDPSQRVNYTENFYRNTGKNGLEEQFNFIHNEAGGEVQPGNMGIDIELMTDTREFSLKTNSLDVQGQVDWMLPAPIPTWLPFIWPTTSESENIYRAVTTTKVINYHAILDHVTVIDKGSQVSTQNLVYDGETGQVIINQTNNEFDKPIYTVSYPAYWAYSGLGPAYQNIDAVYENYNFLDGKIQSPNTTPPVIESGDELYIIETGSEAGCDPAMVSSENIRLIWALNIHKNTSSLTDTDPEYIFIDNVGNPYNRTGVSFRIVRSGKRNQLSAPLATITSMADPVDPTTHKLDYATDKKVINGSAIEYREKWQVDNDVFRRFSTVKDNETCVVSEVEDCNGYLEKKINPYVKGLLGNFRGYRNMIYYVQRALGEALHEFGLLQDFNPYWKFNSGSNLIPSTEDKNWVWNTQTTRFNNKGMELESKNALNIFGSAEYGYNKAMAVAIANNSRSREMFFEGFEDYDYDDLLNQSNYNNCAVRHIDFSNLDNSTIVPVSETGFNAHTGKYMLKVLDERTVSKTIPVTNDLPENYELIYTQDNAKTLDDLGGNYQPAGSLSPSDVLANPAFTNVYNFSSLTGPSAEFQIYPKDDLSSGRFHHYSVDWDFYINITETKTYNFAMSVGTAYNNAGAGTITHFNSIGFEILDLNGNVISSAALGQDGYNYTTDYYTAFLCVGIYKVKGSFTELYDAQNNTGSNYTSNHYSWECTNSSSPCYKSLSDVTTCTFTKPLPADISMQNPTVNLQPGKKMLLSGWVRENCEAPCNITSYSHNVVRIDYGSAGSESNDIEPTGPIIEGWQRVEKEFTVPADATSMTLSLINNGGGNSYWDDIRIHPFNANMKSYVYDPVNLRLKAELDANNYASFYEYDEEGTLIRTKAETKEGVKTIMETRSAKQKNIEDFDWIH